MQEFCLCERCRRTVLIQLLEQYLLEHDMQAFNNEITDRKLLRFEKKINKHKDEKAKDNKRAGQDS